MSLAAAARLATRTASDYETGGHRTYFIPDLTDVAAIMQSVSFQYTASIDAKEVAEASLASILALTGGLQDIGPDPMGLVRASDLGSSAFLDQSLTRGRLSAARGAAYQIVPQDYGLALIAESGTLTWTLPLLSILPTGWWISIWNRSGANLTLNRSGSDLIGVGTSITLGTAAGLAISKRDNTRYERIW